MAKILKILTLPHGEAKLRQISKDIELTELTKPKFKALLVNMARTMAAKDGVGLAAPQIGEAIRLVVINFKNGPIWMINPVITKKSSGKYIDEEGCLSIPGYYAKVKRHKTLICEFLNPEGKKMKVEASGLLSRAVQHEIDHLDGVLFIDRMEKPNGKD